MKRTLFAILGAALAAISLPGGSQGAGDKPAASPAPAQAAPLYETKNVEGTDNVYIFRAGDAQATFVVTSAGVIATDPISYARREEVKNAAREGRCWGAAEKKVTLSKYSAWPGYANGMPLAVRRYCGLWGRGT